MIISDMKEQANEVKLLAKKKVEELEEVCFEKEVRSVFDWVLKVIEENIKRNIIKYDSEEETYIFKQYFYIQENHTIIIEKLANRFIEEELAIYKAKYVMEGILNEVVKKVLDIFGAIEGYEVWDNIDIDSFTIMLKISKEELS